MGYEMEYWESLPEISTCKTDSNSNNTICMKRMRELLRKLKHICHIHQTPCSGTAYAYETTNRSMKNAKTVWNSLRRLGNETSSAIPWENNKTGVIHFTFNSSRHPLKSTNYAKSLENSMADRKGRLVVILIMVALMLLSFSLVVLPIVWRCACGLILKRTLYFRGVLHESKA